MPYACTNGIRLHSQAALSRTAAEVNSAILEFLAKHEDTT
jgi:hypothetical protein